MEIETLEEGFDRIFDSIDYIEFDYASFEQGAKWNQKRSYSKKEVLDILYRFHYDLVNSNLDTKEEWFEQFKKK